MLGRLSVLAALLAVVWETWTVAPGPVLRRAARVIGLFLVLAFAASLLPTAKADPVPIYVLGLGWYVGLGATRWRRKRKDKWPSERQRWPGWFVLSVAYLVYAVLGRLLVTRGLYGPFIGFGVAWYVVLFVVLISWAKGWRLWSREGREEVKSTGNRQLEQMRRYSSSHQAPEDQSQR